MAELSYADRGKTPYKFYRMNGGVAYIYKTLKEMTDGRMPLTSIGEMGGMRYFEDIDISSEDVRFAMQDDISLERRIRIRRDDRINTKNIIRIKNTYYKVWKIRQGINRQGVPITDITLVTAVEEYEVIV